MANFYLFGISIRVEDAVKLAIRIPALLLVLALVISSSGCLHKSGGGQVTPYERAVTYNTMLAQVNFDVQKGVIQLQQSGVLSVSQADAVLKHQAAIADDHEKITNILAKGPDVGSNQSEMIKAAIEDIKSQVQAAITSGNLGIKNPVSQQTFASDAAAIAEFANLLVTQLQIAGVVK